jgi:hypothetical protein
LSWPYLVVSATLEEKWHEVSELSHVAGTVIPLCQLLQAVKAFVGKSCCDAAEQIWCTELCESPSKSSELADGIHRVGALCGRRIESLNAEKPSLVDSVRSVGIAVNFLQNVVPYLIRNTLDGGCFHPSILRAVDALRAEKYIYGKTSL